MDELVPKGYVTQERLHAELQKLEARLSALVEAEKLARQADTSALRLQMDAGFKSIHDQITALTSVIESDSSLSREIWIEFKAGLSTLMETHEIRKQDARRLFDDVDQLNRRIDAITSKVSEQGNVLTQRVTDMINPMIDKIGALQVSFGKFETRITTERRIKNEQRQALFGAIKPLLTPRALSVLAGIILGLLMMGAELVKAVQYLIR